jgi:ATP-dependent helicase Lhr and Lhr-like helicase
VPTDPLELFHAPTRAWLTETLGPPTRAQSLAWPEIASGRTTLLLAPTGSGKTLAAFLSAVDRLMWTPEPPRASRCRVLYVSPLKALAVDVEKNLDAPLGGIEAVAQRMNVAVRRPTVFVRTGDTPAPDRVRMRRAPPDILITTPESLFLILTSGAREILREVDTVIVDEIHSLVPNKRGAHLFLSLERLEHLRRSDKPLQRIGLSATQKPLDEVARLLGGFDGQPRPVSIVDASAPKPLDVRIDAPKVDMSALGEAEGARRSIWPYLHEQIVELVRAHRSTMVFVNSRRLAERLASALNELAGEELALAHHGSVARDRRAIIEDRLKRGDLKAIVATSSLELGIDMGAVDLVIQVESPPSVASGLQRIGRAGHSVGDTSKGILLPKHRGDLLACAAAIEHMRTGDVESTFYPRNPLDVLAQQIVAIAAGDAIGTADLYALIRRAAPFAELTQPSFESVLDMLSGRYASGQLPGLRARITWDRKRERVVAREGAKALAIANAGTIPDRGLYGVFLGGKGDASSEQNKTSSRRVGELDEEMVFELREGEVFLLGASSWKAEKILADRVLVSPAPGMPGKMPFWHGDRAGRPLAFGRAIGQLTRELGAMDPSRARTKLQRAHAVNESGCSNLLAYLKAQKDTAGDAPSDRVLIVERLIDPSGDYRVCLLSPLGSRVHAPWCTAVLERLSSEHGQKADGVWSDDGIVFRLPEAQDAPPASWFLPNSKDVLRIVTEALGHSSLFASHFRESLGRALLLPRRRPGQRTPLWSQRKRASDLLAATSAFPDFPILLETYRECLKDVFDMPGLVDTLRRIEGGELRVHVVDSKTPSPFATSLLFSFVANFIYEGDAPLAERRAQALAIDHERLRELLGETALRGLLDPEVVAEHVRLLSHEGREVKHADGLHDALLELGDLSVAEIEARSPGPWRGFIEELQSAGRIFPMDVRGETRYAAIEDAGRFRAVLGVAPPKDTPDVFLQPGQDALLDLVARYAKTHGPFTLGTIAARWHVDTARLGATLDARVLTGKMVRGEFLPEGHEPEYCDSNVLRALRQKSLARMRRAVEPVPAEVYARFLIEWQLAPRHGPEGVLDVVRQLEGCPLLASALDEDILPARVPGYRRWDLDALCASGQVVWAGIEPVGAHDGRIALYLAEHEAVLGPSREQSPSPATSAAAAKIRELLSRRGAIFFAEIQRELGGFAGDLVAGIWELVWAGEVTNDTLDALRRRRATAPSRGHPKRPTRPGRNGHLSHAAPGTEGRWSLRRMRMASAPSDTEQRASLARMLLDRYGVVGRECVEAESLPGSFSAVYDVLKSMEDAGRIRRGYFVDGMSATQFALPGADDRLRALRSPSPKPRTLVLASTDPANPYGASLPWPKTHRTIDSEAGGAQRAAGARVVLHEGRLLGWLGRTGQSLIVFIDPSGEDHARLAEELAGALGDLVESGKRKVLLLETIDGQDPRTSPIHAALLAAGFSGGARGLHRRRTAPPARDM